MVILSMKEVANLLGIGRTATFQLLHMEGCPSFRVGRRLLVAEKSLVEWLEQGGAEKLGQAKREEAKEDG